MCLILSIQKKVVNISKQVMKLPLLLLLASMMASVNSCEFGRDAIQGLYNRAEVFRKTKVFDTTNRVVPLTQSYTYSYRETDGIKHLEFDLNHEFLTESYKYNAANEIETILLYYNVYDKSSIHLERDENGEFIFRDLLNHIHFLFTLQSIDGELPNNLAENYKKLFLGLKTMRQKMFDFQKGLTTDELKRVRLFDYTLLPNGAFNLRYTENGVGDIFIYSAKADGETISGGFSCKNQYQKFNVVDENVVADGEPF